MNRPVYIDESDFSGEELLSLKKLALLIPEKPSYGAILNWCTNGLTVVQDPERPAVVMGSIQISSTLHSSIHAYQRFINKINDLRRDALRQRHHNKFRQLIHQ